MMKKNKIDSILDFHIPVTHNGASAHPDNKLHSTVFEEKVSSEPSGQDPLCM